MPESKHAQNEEVSDAAPPGIPLLAYFMALISGVFVTFGLMIAVAFSHLFIGDWVVNAPQPVRVAIPYVAFSLGIFSAWQTLEQAKRKAIAKHAKQMTKSA